MRSLRRRRAHHYGLPSDQRHAYRDMLVVLYNNPGETRSVLRHWSQQNGVHRALTERLLSTAERRGHVEVRAGRYYVTARGMSAAWPGG